MTVEKDVSEILANLEGRRPDIWNKQAARVAEGVRDSGILDQIDRASNRLETNLAGLAAVMGVSAQMVATEISTSNTFLQLVVDTLRDPAATAANERFRSGMMALQKGWAPEAIEELEESIKLFRFHPPSHAALGHALAVEGKFADAAASYRLAQRYALPGDPGLAAGCALMAASSLEQVGDISSAVEYLLLTADALPQYPELFLAHARLSGDSESLRRALALAPELAVPALAAGIPNVDEVAAEVAVAKDGPVVIAGHVQIALDGIQRAFPSTLSGSEFERLEGSSGIEALMGAGQILNGSGSLVRQLKLQGRPLGADADGSDHVVMERVGQAESRVIDRKSRWEAAKKTLESMDGRIAGLARDVATAEALFARPPEEFVYATAHINYLPNKLGARGPFLLDQHEQLERDIRAGSISAGMPDFAYMGTKLKRLRLELAQLGVDDAHAFFAFERDTYYSNVRRKFEELNVLIADLTLERVDIEAEVSSLREDLDAEAAVLSEAREAEQALRDRERQMKTAQDALWDELIRKAEAALAEKADRGVPWAGQLAKQSIQ